ncbi:MAG: iron-sulfur cluster assembly accessory protein [Gammaproteobacteria bacterium]|nr:iron-sulfur cluster assembly accessory protein [Gammaproteobacteria bacterium]MCP5135902.1 iron-sulfur cluster assembly accessory protein [Gammaproteobacteria bacterium]
MLTITADAADFIRQSAEQGNTQGMSLRVAAQRKENGEIEYAIGFDNATDDDIEFKTADVKVIVSPVYADLLQNCVMDYAEIAPGERRIIFMNPNDPGYVPPTDVSGDVPTK